MTVPRTVRPLGASKERRLHPSRSSPPKVSETTPPNLCVHSVVNGDGTEIQVLILGGPALPHCGWRRPQGADSDNDGIYCTGVPDVKSVTVKH